MPGVEWSAQVVEREHGFFVLEVALDRDGPMTTTILLDLGGPKQTVLAEIKPNGAG